MIELIGRRFRLLGEPFRLRLLQLLESQERTVGEMVALLGGNQPNISKHLQMLHDGGLVSRRREGTSIYYGIADPVVIQLCELVCKSAAEKAREEFDTLHAELAPAKLTKEIVQPRKSRQNG